VIQGFYFILRNRSLSVQLEVSRSGSSMYVLSKRLSIVDVEKAVLFGILPEKRKVIRVS
jgi:hypothetical protein